MAAKVVRAPMPRSKRAAQFAMFDALKGLKEAIAAKEKHPEPRRILAEDAVLELNTTLTELEQGQMATVVYYEAYEQAYKQITGTVKKVDSFWKTLQIGDITIDFSEIAELHTM